MLLVAPVLWASLYFVIRSSKLLDKVLPHPIGKPWDFVFSQRRPFWIVATLPDGTRIGGSYDGNSFSSSAPHQEQIYLQEAWHINEDGGFERAKESSAGVILTAKEISCLELYEK